MEETGKKILVHGKVCVKDGNERLFISKKNIIMFVKNGRKTDMHTTEGVFQVNDSLNNVEKKLDNRHFFRSHQSFIVNLMMIKKIVTTDLETYIVLEHTVDTALITKQNEKKLYELIEVF